MFVRYVLVCLTFSSLSSIHWMVERIWAFVCFSEHFWDVSCQFSGQIVSTCADVFNIFKFELNPLDGRGDVGICVLFGTFSGHFGSIFRTLV